MCRLRAHRHIKGYLALHLARHLFRHLATVWHLATVSLADELAWLDYSSALWRPTLAHHQRFLCHLRSGLDIEGLDCCFALLQRRKCFRERGFEAIPGAFANHAALRFRAICGSLAFPSAPRLLANVDAISLGLGALELALRLAASRLTTRAISGRATRLRACDDAIRLIALRRASLCRRARASSLTPWRLTLGFANLVTPG